MRAEREQLESELGKARRGLEEMEAHHAKDLAAISEADAKHAKLQQRLGAAQAAEARVERMKAGLERAEITQSELQQALPPTPSPLTSALTLALVALALALALTLALALAPHPYHHTHLRPHLHPRPHPQPDPHHHLYQALHEERSKTKQFEALAGVQRGRAEEEAQRHGEMAAERDRLRVRCAKQRGIVCVCTAYAWYMHSICTACACACAHPVHGMCMVRPALARYEKQQAALTEERTCHSDELASMAARLEAEQLQAAQICEIEPPPDAALHLPPPDAARCASLRCVSPSARCHLTGGPDRWRARGVAHRLA